MPTTLRPNRAALALLLLLLPLLLAHPVGCADHRRLVREQQAPLRHASLEPWQGHRIDNEAFERYALRRALVIFDGVDAGTQHRGDDGSIILTDVTANGRPAEPKGIGSAVALTADGYMLTCAHCVSKPAFLVLGPDDRGGVQQARGRIVWNGRDRSPPVDVALVHAPLNLAPALWADPAEALAGADLFTVGVGIGTSRFAAGRIIGGPTADAEPEPGSFHAYSTDAPNIPGDSGGPAFLRSGALLGICTRIEGVRTRTGANLTTTITRPNPAWINQLIERDRATAPPASPARGGPKPAPAS